jgi:hypothetical protein
MQSTVTEHARSTFAAVTCAECHLPREADGHRSHRFDVSRNTALLRGAIAMASRRTPSGVAVALTTREVGHAMPTGDLFRRLRLVVRGEAADGRHLGEEEVLFARRFDQRRGLMAGREDTRLFGDTEVRLDRPWLTEATRIGVELRYERVAQTSDVVDVRGEIQRREALFASLLIAEDLLESSPSGTGSR